MSISPGVDAQTEPVTLSELLTRATRGAVALGARQVALTLLNVLGAAALARLVSPATFGVFAVASFVVGFLNFFAEAGLGASLIRQRQAPSVREQQAAFTLQVGLSLVVLSLGWFLAPVIAHAVHAVPHTAALIRLGLLSLVISAAQLVPGAKIERDLRFSRLGGINAMQGLVFNGLAVGLAAAGWPVIGIGIAMIAQAATGASLLAISSPWRPGLVVRQAGLRERLRFAVPLQLSSILSSLKDAISPLFVGSLLGARSVGLVEWANAYAAYPVLTLMAFQQVYLPTFSRLQDDPRSLGRATDTVLLGTNMLVAPTACLTFVLATPLTRIIFGEKWLVALPTFRLFWIANLFVASASPLFSLLYARGKAGMALKFTLLWMGTTWVLGVPLIHLFGIEGYALANVGVQLTNFFLFRAAKREAPINILRQFWRPWLVASAVAGVVYTISRLLTASTWAVVTEFAAGLLLYVLVMWRLESRTFQRILIAVRRVA